jgi:hypothetical protein
VTTVRFATALVLALGLFSGGCGGTTGAADASGAGGAAGAGATTGAGGTAGRAAGGSSGSAGTGGGAGSGSGGRGGTGGGTGGSAATGGTIDPDLVLWYPFDEDSGTVANDASGFAGGPRNGTLTTVGTGTAAFSAVHQVGSHALDLAGGSSANGGYVALPDVIALAPDAITIAVWVNLKANLRFQKVFNFGVDEMAWMSLSADAVRPTAPRDAVEFEITTQGDVVPPAERLQDMAGVLAPLPVGEWHHLAVVLQGGTAYSGTLYIDGAVVGTTPLTIRPSALGSALQNYLGRSGIPTTAFASMLLDDFRVYRRALTTPEIAALYALR